MRWRDTSTDREFNDDSVMPFGKHFGKCLSDVPSEYLDWLSGQEQLMRTWPGLAAYIRQSRAAIDQDLKRGGLL